MSNKNKSKKSNKAAAKPKQVQSEAKAKPENVQAAEARPEVPVKAEEAQPEKAKVDMAKLNSMKTTVKPPRTTGRFRTGGGIGYLFVSPYALLFIVFIMTPVIMAIILSFTNFNTIQWPDFVGFMNYVSLITADDVFMKYVLPNTVIYAIVVGIGGYILAFLLAWCLSNLPKAPRTIFAMIIYSPSMTTGVAMAVLWKIMFTGDQTGYINSWLMDIGAIDEPIVWLSSAQYLLPIVIIIGLWSSMGIGFLSILAGLMNIDESLYDAGAIDGIKNRFQEMVYITIPSMKPQMFFAAIMQIVNSFQNGAISSMLAGNPTPGYGAQLIVNHIEDYGFIRYEMGYAAAVSVILLLIVQIFPSFFKRLFTDD